MPIPNEAQATYKDQVEIDTGDMASWEAVHQGYSVLSGATVTEQASPDGTVLVAAGVVKVGGAAVAVAGGNVSVLSGSANDDGSTPLSADSTQARFSLIVVDALGQKGVLHGNPGGLAPIGDGSYTCVFPPFPGKTVIESVFVPPGFTAVADSMLWDKRVLRTDGDFVARVLTPAALTANVADFQPTSAAAFSVCNFLRLSTNSSTQRNISGFNPFGFLDGRMLVLLNLGPGAIGLQNANTGSAAANRFDLASDIVIPPGRSVTLFYDVTSSRWHAIGGQTASGAPAIVLGSAAAAGVSNYFLRDDATIVAFGATLPAANGVASAGTGNVASRDTHVHPGGGLGTDPLWSTKGEIVVATANDVAAVLSPPTTRGQRLGADEAGNVAWAPNGAGPSGYRVFDDMGYNAGFAVTASAVPVLGQAQANMTGTLAAITGSVVVGTSNHPGIAGFATGTTTTGRTALLVMSGGSISLGGGRSRFGAWVQIPVASDGTDRFEVNFGFLDNYSAATVADGCFFTYRDNLNSGKWQATTIANSVSTATVTDTGIAATAGQFYFLEVEVNAAGTSVAYYIDKVLVATHAANIPTGVGRETGALIDIIKSAGTTSRSFYLDAYYLELDFTTAR